MVQGKIHLSNEPYCDVSDEIVPISNPSKDQRVYINMHPYILEPELFMTFDMYPKPKHYADQPEAIGEVRKIEAKGLKQHQIGNSQAWYYPADKLIVLWECYLDSFMRGGKAINEDEHMRRLWHAFEKWLCKQFPDATRLATPFNDPIAETIEEYQTFLRALGYYPSPTAKAAFEKPIQRTPIS